MMFQLRVLVVEDQQSKIAKIIDLMLAIGLCKREEIAVAQTSFDARQKLAATQFDLMILDIVLPNRPEEQPVVDGGVELLREIMIRDRLHRPRYIIGLTAYPDVFQDTAGKFADYTWAIVQYEEEGTSWHDPIVQLVRHIERLGSDAGGDSLTYDYDLCIVTALREELEALLRIGCDWEDLRVAGDSTSYKQGTLVSGDLRCRMVAACCPRMGMISAAVLSANMIRTFSPFMLVSLGICAGIRGKVSIGDIAVADPSWDYQSGKISGHSFEMAPHQLPLHSAIRRRISGLTNQSALAEIKNGWSSRAPNTEIQCHLGPFASGSAVLADSQRVSELKLQHRNLIAIDMEVYGVFSAASEAPAPAPFPIAIKAISDYGDEDKADSSRDYACYVSAALFQKFVREEYAGLRQLMRTSDEV